MKIKIGDNVLITKGKDRGKTGKVLRVIKKHATVVVEKVNIRTKHIKKRPGAPGQRIQYEAPLNASNVAVICPNCSKKTRVSYLRLEGGKKQRVCKKCHQSLDRPYERKKTKKR